MYYFNLTWVQCDTKMCIPVSYRCLLNLTRIKWLLMKMNEWIIAYARKPWGHLGGLRWHWPPVKFGLPPQVPPPSLKVAGDRFIKLPISKLIISVQLYTMLIPVMSICTMCTWIWLWWLAKCNVDAVFIHIKLNVGKFFLPHSKSEFTALWYGDTGYGHLA